MQSEQERSLFNSWDWGRREADVHSSVFHTTRKPRAYPGELGVTNFNFDSSDFTSTKYSPAQLKKTK